MTTIQPTTAWPDKLAKFLGFGLIGGVILPLGIALLSKLFATRQVLLVSLGCFCLIVCLLTIFNCASKIVRFIFLGLAVHALLGYVAAEPSSLSIWIGSSARSFYARSFLVISVGLLVAAMGFASIEPGTLSFPSLNEDRLMKILRRATLLTSVLMFLIYWKMAMLPWQLDLLDIGGTRYIGGLNEWIINRCKDLLTLSAPVLALYGRREKLLSLLALVTLILPLQRAPIFAALIVLTLALVIHSGKVRPLVIFLALATMLYGSTQIFYLGILKQDFENDVALSTVASGLPEVRDLGWVISLNNDEHYWGATLIQPVLPIPSFVFPWVQEHSLRNITTKLIGFERNDIGGLRLTLAGEGYLNFDYFGVIALCWLWGAGMRWIDFAIKAATSSKLNSFFVALVLSWMAFWIYLAGSQAGGVIKTGLIISSVLIYMSRQSRTLDVARVSIA